MNPDNASRLLMILLASEFIEGDTTRSEHCFFRDDFTQLHWQGDVKAPPVGKAVRLTFEYVDEGVACDGGGKA